MSGRHNEAVMRFINTMTQGKQVLSNVKIADFGIVIMKSEVIEGKKQKTTELVFIWCCHYSEKIYERRVATEIILGKKNHNK